MSFDLLQRGDVCSVFFEVGEAFGGMDKISGEVVGLMWLDFKRDFLSIETVGAHYAFVGAGGDFISAGFDGFV